MDLKSKRKQIDKLDNKLIKILETRFKIAREIADWKKSKNIKIKDKNRENEIIAKYKKSNLPKSFINELCNLLFSGDENGRHYCC